MDEENEKVVENEGGEEPQAMTLADIASAIDALAEVVSGIVDSIEGIDGRLNALTAARIEDGAEFTDGSNLDDVEDAAEEISEIGDEIPEVVTMDDIEELDLDL